MKHLRHTILLLSVFFTSFAAMAQPARQDNFIDVALLTDSVLLNNCLVFLDSNNNVSPAEVLNQKWRPLSEYKIKTHIPESWVTKRVYLKLQIANSANNNDSIYFLPGISFSSIRVFDVLENNGLQQVKDESKLSGYQPLLIGAAAKKTFIAELRFTKFIFTYLTPQLIKRSYLDKYKKIQYYRNAPMQMAGYVISGILIMMFIFSMANYILSKKIEFALNGCYVTCMFLLIFLSTFLEKKGGVITSFFMSYMAFALLAIGTVFYIAFTRKFLDTKKNFPLLNKMFIYEERAVLLLLVSYSFIHFFTGYFALQRTLEVVMKITALALGIVYIVTAFVQKNRLLNYLAIGNAMLIGFAIVSFYMLEFPKRGSIFFNSLFYYELGIVFELMFFILGLAYKNRIELIEKIKEQEALKLEAEKQIFETKLAVLDARQKERNRISADMHDELGAGITAIRLYSELAKSKPDKNSMPEIEKISHSANELLNSMNTIIWAMSNSNDSLENMIAYIRSYSQEYFENTGVRCRINIMEGLPNVEVSGAIRKNVFLVVKETLNNILKHAKATEVNITLTKVSDGLALHIQDNGIGIDLEKIRRFGNGLKNMQKRMEEMNIDFSIENKNGTLVTLHYAIEL
jgi:signal transduction histidine kinase